MIAGDPYDPANDLKLFYGKAIVRANTSLTLPDTGPGQKLISFRGLPAFSLVFVVRELQRCGAARRHKTSYAAPIMSHLVF